MIAVLIVGFNSIKYLPDCLESLFASSYNNFQVFFVDNNSSDDSLSYIKEKYPQVKIIKNHSNLGFAGGNNIGIRAILEEKKYDYVFLANADTHIDKNCLQILVEKANNNSIVQPLILLHEKGKQTNIINTTGNHLNFLGISYCNQYRQDKNVAREVEIPAASGAAVLIPVNALRKVGLFDERFFMYYEDVDLFWRMRQAGFQIRLIPEAKIWHKYSFSENPKKMFFIERNRIIFLLKNFSLKYLLLILPALLVNELLMLIYSVFAGWSKEKINALIGVINVLPTIIKERKTFLKHRLLGESELKQFISYKLEFSEFNNPLFKIYNVLLFLWWRLIYYII